MGRSKHKPRFAFVGTYVPRRCGIATFTSDLCEAVAAEAGDAHCFAVAMNDQPAGYPYPSRVRFEIEASRREQYDLAADFLNVNQIDVVCVQHEYGIFGGRSGRHLLPLLRQLRSPLVATLHTVLTDPSPDQRQVMNDLCELADRLVVMSPRASHYLRDIYNVPEEKVRMIHHGIPDMPFVDPSFHKDELGAAGRRVMLTFGLMSPGKGIEYAIDALPPVVAEYPDLLYIVLGATHPHVKRDCGEEYRTMLQQRVRQLGLTENVVFHNRFVDIAELCEYLGAADIYATPYLNPAQITSGTLAYAMGTGKAVISTPYWYAEDMLAEGRGRLAEFRSAESLTAHILDLLRNETERHAMRKRAYLYGRSMIWPAVGRAYLDLFREIRDDRRHMPRPMRAKLVAKDRFENLPDLNPRHLITLTDSVGIQQHARFTVPNPNHGYSTDDQARALIVAERAGTLRPDAADWHQLTTRYLSFLLYAYDSESSRFGNFLSFRKEWTKPVATEDVHARTLWALGHVVAHDPDEGHRDLGMQLLEQALPISTSFSSPRACAYTILAIQVCLQRFGGASTFRRERQELAGKLFDLFKRNSSDDWPWPEDQLTYANARLPQALIEAGQWMPEPAMVECGLRALDWLDRVQTAEAGHLSPIGTDGWFKRGGSKARFDQQPIEAHTMLEACLAAYRLTGEARWLQSGRRAFDWFLGRNDLAIPVYDFQTGGCHDGLHADRLNQNQGAESTIVWLLSLISMYEIQEEITQAKSARTGDS